MIVPVAVIVGMYARRRTATTTGLRELLAGKDGTPPIEPEALAAYLDSRVPDILAASAASACSSWSG